MNGNKENKDLEDLFCLENKVALVTGGAGYLGTAISYSLAELGATVILASRDVEKCKERAQEICDHFDNPNIALGYKLDITDDELIDDLFNFINEEFGQLDILVNNAYSGKTNSFESISEEQWIKDIDTGLTSVFRVIKNSLELLKKSEGVILNIASMYGHIAPDPEIYEGNDFTNPPSYGAAKAGVIQLTKYLATFLSKYNIRANAISPGPFPHGSLEEDEEFMERLRDKNPLNRTGKAYELKGAVALLCSEASSFITGENICVDGGWSTW